MCDQTTQPEPEEIVFVLETEHADGIVVDHTGKIVYNAFQTDDPVIRKIDSRGNVHLFRKSNGSVIMPPFNPEDGIGVVPRCTHCGELPW